MLRLRKQYFFEFFEFLLKMRTYDLIQPKSNCSDRNLIIRATRGAHPMAVRTRRSAKTSTFFSSVLSSGIPPKSMNSTYQPQKPCNCPTNEYDEIYYLLSSQHPVKCQSYLAVQSVLVKSPSLAAKGLFIVQNSLTWTFRLTYTSRLVFNAQSVPDLAPLTVFGRCQAQKIPT